MEAVGLRLLEGAALLSMFQSSGTLPQTIAARVNFDKFSKINTARGSWSLIHELTTVPQSSSGLAWPAVPGAAVQIAEPAHPASTASLSALSLEEARRIVRATAVEVLGEELGDDGHLPAGNSNAVSGV